MSEHPPQEHLVCIVCEDLNRFEPFTNKFSAISKDAILLTSTLFNSKTYNEISDILSRSTFLIVLFDSKSLDCNCINCTVQHFAFLGKDNNIIPIFVGQDFDDKKVVDSLLHKRFGNRIIESKRFSLDELFNAIQLRIKGLSDFTKPTIVCSPPTNSDNVFYVRNSTVIIKSGSIIDSKCDVIVSSDDNLITHGGGVSLAIFQKGGPALEKDAKKNIPAELGDIVVTSAGNLTQKLIFHAITLALAKNNNNNLSQKDNIDIQEYIVSNAMRRGFYLLSSLQLSSIAFPVIGTGTARIPFEKAIKCMLSIFAEQLQKTAKPLLVELWVYNDNGIDIASIAKEILPQNKPEQDAFQQPTSSEQTIFISYCRKDIDKARVIIEFLKEKGLQYWIDIDGSYSGKNYKSVIVQAINQSQIVLFLSSESSNKSDNVAKEISLAVLKGKQIIPLKIDSAPYSDEIAYDLSPIDFIEYKNDSASLQKLYFSIQNKMGH